MGHRYLKIENFCCSYFCQKKISPLISDIDQQTDVKTDLLLTQLLGELELVLSALV